MRRIFLSVLAAALLTLASHAFAVNGVHQEYDTFSIDYPEGWAADRKATASYETFTLSNPEETALVSVVVKPTSGMTSQNYAEVTRKNLKGSALRDNGDGMYSFTYDMDGIKCRSLLGVKGEQGFCITVAGQDPNLKAVVASVTFKVKTKLNLDNLF